MPGRRADEDQRAVAFELPEKAARGEEGRGQVRRRACARQRSSGSSQTGKSSGGHAPATAAQTSSAPDSREHALDLGLLQSGPRRQRARCLPAQLRAPPRASRPWWKCTTTCAPSAANARAHAEPMPPEPPVTSTRFPFSPVSICGILSVVERERMTWDDLGSAVEDLASQIHADGFSPDAVLALARGGLPCAGALAYALGVKNMATLNVEFYTGVDERLDEPLLLPPGARPCAAARRTPAARRRRRRRHRPDARPCARLLRRARSARYARLSCYEKPQSVVALRLRLAPHRALDQLPVERGRAGALQ